jgi:asparagine synthase (glutamine-hydrolysing)
MSNEEGTVWVVHNGEIYNFQELRQYLQARGHLFRTSSDTEVIIRVYEEFGPAGVEKLRGMFAFALWDMRRRTLLLARDQVGIKPLYYYRDREGLSFASEIRSLLLEGRTPRRLSLSAMDRFLSFSFVPGEDTIFDGIRRLPPGHLMICRGKQVEIRPYWRLDVTPDPGGREGRYVAELRERMEEAVRRHLVADVPVGVFLSGGIDSSSIVALLAQMGRRDTPLFSVGFADGASYFNEVEDAKRVAKYFGMNHCALTVRPDIANLLPQMVGSIEEPMGDPSAFLTYLISRAAREHVKVALTGIGGDELFAGYRRHMGACLVASLRRFPGAFGNALLRRGMEWLPATEESRFGYHITTLRRLLDATQAPHPDAYISMLSYFTPVMKRQLYSSEVQTALADYEPATEFRSHFARPQDGDLLSRIFYLDLMVDLPNNRLLYSDKMSMASSLELRVPFLDLELVQFAAKLPASLRIRGLQLKYLLRKAMLPLLPPAVLAKPKQGFTAPVGRWIRRDLKAYVGELLSSEAISRRGLWDSAYVAKLLTEHQAGRRDWGRHLFALMIFELWYRTFMEGAVADLCGVDPSRIQDAHHISP